MESTATHTKTCSACAYWKETTSGEGECRVRSPQAIVFKVDAGTQFESRFPETKASDWCGEFSAK
ncbi:hypothetical protein [Cerasicoccus fimbriatus]|uniref:hypothetical protein n=1 Tax=Cerasicoccus fimbriatus TaxID=3014554 RepID=UPI0022B3D8F1|nr:hypothetical protein [Cerasicoccus sp. TK19100]